MSSTRLSIQQIEKYTDFIGFLRFKNGSEHNAFQNFNDKFSQFLRYSYQLKNSTFDEKNRKHFLDTKKFLHNTVGEIFSPVNLLDFLTAKSEYNIEEMVQAYNALLTITQNVDVINEVLFEDDEDDVMVYLEELLVRLKNIFDVHMPKATQGIPQNLMLNTERSQQLHDETSIENQFPKAYEAYVNKRFKEALPLFEKMYNELQDKILLTMQETEYLLYIRKELPMLYHQVAHNSKIGSKVRLQNSAKALVQMKNFKEYFESDMFIRSFADYAVYYAIELYNNSQKHESFKKFAHLKSELFTLIPESELPAMKEHISYALDKIVSAETEWLERYIRYCVETRSDKNIDNCEKRIRVAFVTLQDLKVYMSNYDKYAAIYQQALGFVTVVKAIRSSDPEIKDNLFQQARNYFFGVRANLYDPLYLQFYAQAFTMQSNWQEPIGVLERVLLKISTNDSTNINNINFVKNLLTMCRTLEAIQRMSEESHLYFINMQSDKALELNQQIVRELENIPPAFRPFNYVDQIDKHYANILFNLLAIPSQYPERFQNENLQDKITRQEEILRSVRGVYPINSSFKEGLLGVQRLLVELYLRSLSAENSMSTALDIYSKAYKTLFGAMSISETPEDLNKQLLFLTAHFSRFMANFNNRQEHQQQLGQLQSLIQSAGAVIPSKMNELMQLYLKSFTHSPNELIDLRSTVQNRMIFLLAEPYREEKDFYLVATPYLIAAFAMLELLRNTSIPEQTHLAQTRLTYFLAEMETIALDANAYFLKQAEPYVCLEFYTDIFKDLGAMQPASNQTVITLQQHLINFLIQLTEQYISKQNKIAATTAITKAEIEIAKVATLSFHSSLQSQLQVFKNEVEELDEMKDDVQAHSSQTSSSTQKTPSSHRTPKSPNVTQNHHVPNAPLRTIRRNSATTHASIESNGSTHSSPTRKRGLFDSSDEKASQSLTPDSKTSETNKKDRKKRLRF